MENFSDTHDVPEIGGKFELVILFVKLKLAGKIKSYNKIKIQFDFNSSTYFLSICQHFQLVAFSRIFHDIIQNSKTYREFEPEQKASMLQHCTCCKKLFSKEFGNQLE